VPVSAQISSHAACLFGVSTIRFFREAATFLRCELAADLLYELDGLTIHYDVYNIEAEALGARLIWEEGQIPAVDSRVPLLASAEAFQGLPALKVGRAGRMPYVLEINRRLKDAGLSPKVRFTGPFTLAANLLGLEELILAIMTTPARVHALLQFLTREVIAPWVACQREHCGSNETATGSDALASPPITTVEMVGEFCLPYFRELEKLVGGIRLAGLWGESFVSSPRALLDIKAEGSPGSIQVLDPDVSALGPAFFRGYADERGVSLVMGMDAHLVGCGPVSRIESRAGSFIEEGGPRGRFVLFMNDVPLAAPCENVQAVVSVARSYRADLASGSYSRSGNGRSATRWLSREEAFRGAREVMGEAGAAV
jgi:uroporphyrinogen-III decarboxylase